MSIKSQKTGRLNGLQAFFLVGVGCLLGCLGLFGQVLAGTALITENFDSYTAYNLGAVGGIWDNTADARISTDQFESAPNSGRAYNTERRFNTVAVDPVAVGVQHFSFYGKTGLNANTDYELWFQDNNNFLFRVRFVGEGNGFRANAQGNNYDGNLLLMNQWYNLAVEWDGTRARLSTDDGNTWGAWVDYSSAGTPNKLYGFGNGLVEFFLDNFDGGEPPFIAGTYPVITPTTPVDFQSTRVDFDNFNIQGTITIPTESNYKWYSLTAVFKNTAGIDVVAKQIMFPTDLIAGESYQYSATTTIPNALADSVYSVEYNTSGYLSNVGISAPYYPIGTYVTETGTPADGIPIIAIPQWIPPTLEDCTNPVYNFLEKTTCQIQNLILGSVIPSSESVNNLFGTFQQFNTRFPFSYVNEIFLTFNAVRSGLNESQNISINILGKQGNVSLAFWQSVVTVGGISTTIGAVIKLILTFFLYLIFLFWGINYLHKLI